MTVSLALAEYDLAGNSQDIHPLDFDGRRVATAVYPLEGTEPEG